MEMIARREQPGIEVISSYDIVISTEEFWREAIRNRHDKIVIFDDLNIVGTSEFAALCKEYIVKNNLYLILISREKLDEAVLGEVLEEDGGNVENPKKRKLYEFDSLSYSINCIYKMCNDGGIHHWLMPMYQTEQPDESTVFDACLTEDKTAGNEFFRKLLPIPVESAGSGKSTVIENLQEIDSKKQYRSILLIIDTSAFGCHIEELYHKMQSFHMKVYFMEDFESFEEMLLRTNLFRNTEDCESDRSCEKYIKSKCTEKLAGEKFQSLLEHTKYERFLKWRENIRKGRA